jgi:hypothetical protein
MSSSSTSAIPSDFALMQAVVDSLAFAGPPASAASLELFESTLQLVPANQIQEGSAFLFPGVPLNPVDPMASWESSYWVAGSVEGAMALANGSTKWFLRVGSHASCPLLRSPWVANTLLVTANVTFFVAARSDSVCSAPLPPPQGMPTVLVSSSSTPTTSTTTTSATTLPTPLSSASSATPDGLSADVPVAKPSVLEYALNDADGILRTVYTKAGAVERVRRYQILLRIWPDSVTSTFLHDMSLDVPALHAKLMHTCFHRWDSLSAFSNVQFFAAIINTTHLPPISDPLQFERILLGKWSLADPHRLRLHQFASSPAILAAGWPSSSSS